MRPDTEPFPDSGEQEDMVPGDLLREQEAQNDRLEESLHYMEDERDRALDELESAQHVLLQLAGVVRAYQAMFTVCTCPEAGDTKHPTCTFCLGRDIVRDGDLEDMP